MNRPTRPSNLSYAEQQRLMNMAYNQGALIHMAQPHPSNYYQQNAYWQANPAAYVYNQYPNMMQSRRGSSRQSYRVGQPGFKPRPRGKYRSIKEFKYDARDKNRMSSGAKSPKHSEKIKDVKKKLSPKQNMRVFSEEEEDYQKKEELKEQVREVGGKEDEEIEIEVKIKSSKFKEEKSGNKKRQPSPEPMAHKILTHEQVHQLPMEELMDFASRLRINVTFSDLPTISKSLGNLLVLDPKKVKEEGEKGTPEKKKSIRTLNQRFTQK